MLGSAALLPRAVAAPAGGSGPVLLRAVLPTTNDGKWVPLLSAGEPGRGDVVFCRRLADGRVVFGWEQTGRAACLSEPRQLPVGSPVEVMISLGSLLPAATDPRFERQPEMARLRGLAVIQVQGRTALVARGEFAQAGQVASPGRNAVGGVWARALYPERLEAVGAADWEAVLAATFSPARLVADDAATGRPGPGFPGPLKLKLMLAEGAARTNQPLVVTGVTSAGDFVYVRHVDERHVQIGYDHWLVGGPISDPVSYDPTRPVEVVVSMGALLPPPDGAHPDTPEVAELRRRNVVLFDGRVVVDFVLPSHPATAEQIKLFINTIGGSTGGEVFTGAILSVEAVRPEEVLRAVR